MEALESIPWGAITSEPAWDKLDTDTRSTLFDEWRGITEDSIDLDTATPDQLRQFGTINDARLRALQSTDAEGNGTVNELHHRNAVEALQASTTSKLRNSIGWAKSANDLLQGNVKTVSPDIQKWADVSGFLDISNPDRGQWTTRVEDGKLHVNPFLASQDYKTYKEEILKSNAPKREKIDALGEYRHARSIALSDLHQESISRSLVLWDRVLPGADMFTGDMNGEHTWTEMTNVEEAKMYLRPTDEKEMGKTGALKRLDDPGLVDDVALRWLKERGLSKFAEEVLNGDEEKRTALKNAYSDSLFDEDVSWAKDLTKPAGQLRRMSDDRVVINPLWAMVAPSDEIRSALKDQGVPKEDIKAHLEMARDLGVQSDADAINTLLGGNPDLGAEGDFIDFMSMAKEVVLEGTNSNFRLWYAGNKDKYDTDRQILEAYQELRHDPGLIEGLKRLSFEMGQGPLNMAAHAVDLLSEDGSFGEKTADFLREFSEKAKSALPNLEIDAYTLFGGSLPGMDHDETVEYGVERDRQNAAMNKLFGGGRKWGGILGGEVAIIAATWGAGAVIGKGARAGMTALETKFASNVAVANVQQKIATYAVKNLGSDSSNIMNTIGKTIMNPVYSGFHGTRSASGAYRDAYMRYKEEAISNGLEGEPAEEQARYRALFPAVGAGVITVAAMKYIKGGTEAIFKPGAFHSMSFKQVKAAMGDAWSVNIFKSKATRAAMGEIFKPFVKHSSMEALEEFVDEAAQGFLAMGTYNPQMSVGEAMGHAAEAALAGAILGAAGGFTGQSAQDQQVDVFRKKIVGYMKETAVDSQLSSPQVSGVLMDAANQVQDGGVSEMLDQANDYNAANRPPIFSPDGSNHTPAMEKTLTVILGEASAIMNNPELDADQKKADLRPIRGLLNSLEETENAEKLFERIINAPGQTVNPQGTPAVSTKASGEQLAASFYSAVDTFEGRPPPLPSEGSDAEPRTTPLVRTRTGVESLILKAFGDSPDQVTELTSAIDVIFGANKLLSDTYVDATLEFKGKSASAKTTNTAVAGKTVEALLANLDGQFAALDQAKEENDIVLVDSIKSKIDEVIQKAYGTSKAGVKSRLSKALTSPDKGPVVRAALASGEDATIARLNGLMEVDPKSGEVIRIPAYGKLLRQWNKANDKDVKADTELQEAEASAGADTETETETKTEEGQQADGENLPKRKGREEAKETEEAEEAAPKEVAEVDPTPDEEADADDQAIAEENVPAVDPEMEEADPIADEISRQVRNRTIDSTHPDYGMTARHSDFNDDKTKSKVPRNARSLAASEVNEAVYKVWDVELQDGKPKGFRPNKRYSVTNGHQFVNDPAHMAGTLAMLAEGQTIAVPEGVKVNPNIEVDEEGNVVAATTFVSEAEYLAKTGQKWPGKTSRGMIVVEQGGEYVDSNNHTRSLWALQEAMVNLKRSDANKKGGAADAVWLEGATNALNTETKQVYTEDELEFMGEKSAPVNFLGWAASVFKSTTDQGSETLIKVATGIANSIIKTRVYNGAKGDPDNFESWYDANIRTNPTTTFLSGIVDEGPYQSNIMALMGDTRIPMLGEGGKDANEATSYTDVVSRILHSVNSHAQKGNGKMVSFEAAFQNAPAAGVDLQIRGDEDFMAAKDDGDIKSESPLGSMSLQRGSNLNEASLNEDLGAAVEGETSEDYYDADDTPDRSQFDSPVDTILSDERAGAIVDSWVPHIRRVLGVSTDESSREYRKLADLKASIVNALLQNVMVGNKTVLDAVPSEAKRGDAMVESVYQNLIDTAMSRAANKITEELVIAEFEAMGIEEGSTTADLVQSLRAILDGDYSTKHKVLAQMLLDNPGLLRGVKFELTNAPEVNWAGKYNHKTKTITLNTAKANPRGVADTLIHEVLHKALDHIVRKPLTAEHKLFVKNIDNIIRAARIAEGQLSANNGEAVKWLSSIATRIADNWSIADLKTYLKSYTGKFRSLVDLDTATDEEIRAVALDAKLDDMKVEYYIDGVLDLSHALGTDGDKPRSVKDSRGEFLVHLLTDDHFQQFLKRIESRKDGSVVLSDKSLWGIALRNIGRVLTGRRKVGEGVAEAMEEALHIVGENNYRNPTAYKKFAALINKRAEQDGEGTSTDDTQDFRSKSPVVKASEAIKDSESRAKGPGLTSAKNNAILRNAENTRDQNEQSGEGSPQPRYANNPRGYKSDGDPANVRDAFLAGSKSGSLSDGEFSTEAEEKRQIKLLRKHLPKLSKEVSDILVDAQALGQEHKVKSGFIDGYLSMVKARFNLDDGGVQFNTPLGYLTRVAQMNHLFGTDFRVEGMDPDGRIIVSQVFVESDVVIDEEGNREPTPPEMEQVEDYMDLHDFARPDEDPTGDTWVRGSTTVSDAAPKNFVLSTDGDVIPVDLEIELKTLASMEDDFVGGYLPDDDFLSDDGMFGEEYSRAASPMGVLSNRLGVGPVTSIDEAVSAVVRNSISEADSLEASLEIEQFSRVLLPEYGNFRELIDTLASYHLNAGEPNTAKIIDRLDVLVGAYGPKAAKTLAEVEHLIDLAHPSGFMGSFRDYNVGQDYSGPGALLHKGANALGIDTDLVDVAEEILAEEFYTAEDLDATASKQVRQLLSYYKSALDSFAEPAAGLRLLAENAVVKDVSYSSARDSFGILKDLMVGTAHDKGLQNTLNRDSFRKEQHLAMGLENNPFKRMFTTSGKRGSLTAPIFQERENSIKRLVEDANARESNIQKAKKDAFGDNPTEAQNQNVNIVLGSINEEEVREAGAPGQKDALEASREALLKPIRQMNRVEHAKIHSLKTTDPVLFVKLKRELNKDYAANKKVIQDLYESDLNKIYAQAANHWRNNVIPAAHAALRREAPELLDQLIGLRAQVDALSAELLNSGLLEDESMAELKIKIQNNVGIYLTRSYEINDMPGYKNWLSKLTPEAERRVKNARKELMGNLIQEDVLRIENALAKTGATMTDADILDQATKNTSGKTDKVDKALSDFLNSVDGVTVEGRNGMLDMNILEKRTDISRVMRELMGQYDDNIYNATKSTIALGTLLANRRFLADIKIQLEKANAESGKVVITEDRKIAGENNLVRLAGDSVDEKSSITSKKALGPLAESWVTPEFKEAIDEMSPLQLGKAHATIMWIASQSMANMTTRRARTHVRNFWGNWMFLTHSGNSLSTVTALMRNVRNGKAGVFGEVFHTEESRQDAFREHMGLYTELGVRGTDIQTNLNKELMARVAESGSYIHEYNPLKGPVPEAIGKKMAQADDFSNRAYQAGDDFWKIMHFEILLAKHAQAFKIIDGKTRRKITPNEMHKTLDNMTDGQAARLLEVFPPLTPADQAKVDAGSIQEGAKWMLLKATANKVRMTMPVYNNTIELVNLMKRYGVTAWAAPFISFKAEIARITVDNFRLANQESKTPELRGMSRARYTGQAASTLIGGATVGSVMKVGYMLVSAAGAALTGGDDDEELTSTGRELKNAMRRFISSYYADGSFTLMERNASGEVTWMDTSYMLPFASLTDPLFMIGDWRRDEATQTRVQDAVVAWFSPYFAKQLWISALAKSGKDLNKIQGEVEPNPLWATAKGLFDAGTSVFIPGTIVDAMKIAKSVNSPFVNGSRVSLMKELSSNLIGSKLNITDVGYRYEKSLQKWSIALSSTEQDFNRLYRSRSTLSAGQMEKTFLQVNKTRARILREMHLDLKAARLLVPDGDKIQRIFNDSKLSRHLKVSILNSNAPRWVPSKGTFQEGDLQSRTVGDNRFEDFKKYYRQAPSSEALDVDI